MISRIKPHYLYSILVVGILVLTFWITWSVSWQQSLQGLEQANQQYLEQFSGHLDSRLSRFRFLPQLVAKNNLLSELLRTPDRLSNVQAVNRFLKEVNQITGASDTYLMDTTGLTIAASNWREKLTFVGQNFSFRPYFALAMQGRVGHYFALGTTSKERGYYFSYPVRHAAGIVGVLVIKMDMSNIEQYWSNQNTQFMVSDPDGVIFITTTADWLYRSIRPLSQQDMERIRGTLRYGDASVNPLTYQPGGKVSDNSRIVKMGLPGQEVTRYLASLYEMPEAGWSVQVLTPLHELTSGSLVMALTVLLLVISILSISLLVRLRIKRQHERERIRREAQKQLEKMVSERTQDLENEILLHKKTEKTLRATQDELIQAAKLALVGEMSTSISHELNNPLAAIRSYADNARQFLAKNKGQKVDENLGRIAGLTERMAKISNQLKFFSRKSSGQLEPTNLNPVIQTAIEIAGPQYQKKHIQINKQGVESAIYADVDIIQLEQVLINLISNAVHAIGDENEGEIGISTEQVEGSIFIHVDDSGPGIDEEDLCRIFEPFFTTRDAGLGLGLSISSRIITSMNGKLSARNLSGAGARFTISLPGYTQSNDSS
ncbi:MAG: sensor histidine kinase [Gammaproteobacteria bacterium]|nr:sensor histidine kinase [Gammaproteobacteria bacterium]